MKAKKTLMSVLMATCIMTLTAGKSNADSGYSGNPSGGRCSAGAYAQDSQNYSDQPYNYGSQSRYYQSYSQANPQNNPEDFDRFSNRRNVDSSDKNAYSWFGRSYSDGKNWNGDNQTWNRYFDNTSGWSRYADNPNANPAGRPNGNGRCGPCQGNCPNIPLDAPCGQAGCGVKDGTCPTGYDWQRDPRCEVQKPSCPSCYILNQKYGPSSGRIRYNPNAMRPLRGETLDEFKGVVKNMNQVNYPTGNQIHMILTLDNGEDVTVVVGPSSFLNQSRVKIQSGDKVLVVGSRVRANGEEMIVATEVSKNGNSLQLRDAEGNPVWQQQQPTSEAEKPKAPTLKKETKKESI